MDFDELFTKNKPVIFAFHAYPWLIHRLTYRRTNHANIHVRGYKEEGTITTPFDMTVLNDLDRFHLVMDVIDRLPQTGSKGALSEAATAGQADRAHHDPGDPWDKQELDLPGYKERLRISRTPFPDQCFSIQGLVAEGNIAVLTWLWSGTHLGNIPGFPATGNNIKMSGATVYYVGGGRLTGHWQIIDRHGVYIQLRQGAAATADR
jgi:predicted ester cyclase